MLQRELDNEYQYEAYSMAEGQKKRRANCLGVSCEPHKKSARATNPSANNFWYRLGQIILAFVGISFLFYVLIPAATPGIMCWESREEVHIEYSFFDVVFLIILMILDLIAGVLLWKYGKKEKQKS